MRIILFDIDCLRPDHLGCYGYDRPTSPAIDAVARQGMRFERYFCASSPCMPSRMALVSGRFGVNNGVISNVGAGTDFRIRRTPYGGPKAEEQMLMRQLRKTGLQTISFSNFADRHCAFWFTCGFSEFHTPNLKCGGENGDEVNAAVLPWLKANARRENFLLHINYWDTHRIYRMDASWAEPLADYPVRQSWPDERTLAEHQSYPGAFTARGQFRDHRSTVPLMPGAVTSRADFEHMITGYDAAIRYVDAHVRQVLDELDRQGVLADAAVIITSDHGDAFGEHGIYSDHVCADECIQRVPLIVRWPGVTPAGGSCRDLLYNVDFSATLCQMFGAEVPAGWDGVGFAPQLRGRAGTSVRDHLVWDCGLYTVQRAVRADRHLMIRTYDDHGYRFRPVELYDIESDPHQTTDLAERRPEVVARCQSLMDQWLDRQRSRHEGLVDPVDLILAERGKSR